MTNVPMRRRGPYEFMLTTVGNITAAIGIGYGVSLIAGGPQRTAGVAFDHVREAAPIEAWGMLFVLCGLAALLGQALQAFRVVAVAHVVGGLACFGLAAAFAVGLDNPRVPFTGPWIYMQAALVHWVVAVAAWRS